MSISQRRPKRFLTAEQKYDLWVRMLTGQLTQGDATPFEQIVWHCCIEGNRLHRGLAVDSVQTHSRGLTGPFVAAGEESLDPSGVSERVSRLNATVPFSAPAGLQMLVGGPIQLRRDWQGRVCSAAAAQVGQ
jgi:hypothetical protein